MHGQSIGIIGGGAAGFFAAINLAEKTPETDITILEKSQNVLTKVRISGGGRCNLTNTTTDTNSFLANYPRGQKELRSVFLTHGSKNTIEWFESRGIKLKKEKDGRIFPSSNKSETIVDFFMRKSNQHKIKIIKNYPVSGVDKQGNSFCINKDYENRLYFDKILVAIGGSKNTNAYEWIRNLNHKIVEPVPSLFTFNLTNSPFKGLEGVSINNVSVKIADKKITQTGDLLFTHTGLSGPVILKLSAWEARTLFELKYIFPLEINFLQDYNSESARNILKEIKSTDRNKIISKHTNHNLPLSFWQRIVMISGISDNLKWTDVSNKLIECLANNLTGLRIAVSGKSTNKEEFVTCGGVSLKDINFKTMESKICPGLYFAGEVLDIDALTGGFNFQSAWSTAYIAADSISKVL